MTSFQQPERHLTQKGNKGRYFSVQQPPVASESLAYVERGEHGYGESEGHSRARFPTKEESRLKRMKRWRLIVRNLPFTCTEEEIVRAFAPFGQIQEYKIPQKDGHCSGFAFVQFRRFPDAYKALKTLNATTFMKRTIALDWALPKDQYMTSAIEDKQQAKSTAEDRVTISSKKSEKLSVPYKKIKEEPEERVADKSRDQAVRRCERLFDPAKKIKQDPGVPSVSREGGKVGKRRHEESEGSDSSEMGFRKRTRQDGSEKVNDSDQLSSSSEGFSRDVKPAKVIRRREDHGIQEGRTLFVRNLPFEVTDEELGESFSRFGSLKYALVCKYPNTSHSKGSGFVQFVDKESVEKCLHEANISEGTGVYVRNQLVVICRAVSREEVAKIEHEKVDEKHKPKDKRNLHLFKAGLISHEEASVSGMSKHDVSLRMKIQHANKEKIKNLHVFVSPTRICVHNLPLGLKDIDLKKLCYEAVSEDGGQITECRIMRDMTQLNKDKIGKSRGYAFVNFTDHAHALKCLQQLNNNPEIFSSEKRPIVEFALENKAVLNLKQRRLEHSRAKLMQIRSGECNLNNRLVEVGCSSAQSPNLTKQKPGQGRLRRRSKKLPDSTKLMTKAEKKTLGKIISMKKNRRKANAIMRSTGKTAQTGTQKPAVRAEVQRMMKVKRKQKSVVVSSKRNKSSGNLKAESTGRKRWFQ